jgi:hypothetical protein
MCVCYIVHKQWRLFFWGLFAWKGNAEEFIDFTEGILELAII